MMTITSSNVEIYNNRTSRSIGGVGSNFHIHDNVALGVLEVPHTLQASSKTIMQAKWDLVLELIGKSGITL